MTSLDRRRLLASAAGVAGAGSLLAACGDDPPSDATDASGDSSGSSVPVGTVLASVSEVPEGGGVILSEDKLVITQPSQGEFKAFSAVCTHQGCLVSAVTETIDCSCHGSAFSIEDGSPVEGPATSALAETQVRVKGDGIVRA